ncbi:MAG: hypothetical protein IKJ99_09705 [Oscillospiraceae bacterium]|nr:hypothetical protein [Oscillospiraceae bacterium]
MEDLIYNQRDIPKSKWRYGLRTSAATGCGWIATYNSLRLMNYRAKPEDLIRYYERQFPLVHGNAGTSILAPAIFFWQKGFRVRLGFRSRKFDDLVKKSDVCILFYYWRRKFRIGAHFVALRWEDGRITGYNTYRNSTGPDSYGESLEKFLQQRKYFFPVLIGIRDKRQNP